MKCEDYIWYFMIIGAVFVVGLFDNHDFKGQMYLIFFVLFIIFCKLNIELSNISRNIGNIDKIVSDSNNTIGEIINVNDGILGISETLKRYMHENRYEIYSSYSTYDKSSHRTPYLECKRHIPLNALKSEIYAYRTLEDNWNDDAAMPIEEDAIKRSLQLLHFLNKRNLFSHRKLPEIEPSPNGGIDFSWGSFWDSFSIHIPPDKDSMFCYECWSGYESDDLPVYTLDSLGYTSNMESLIELLIDNTSCSD
jgi:hypothetical protein